MNAWIGPEDRDFRSGRPSTSEMLTQYVRYLNHVLANVGGIYLAEKMEGDPVEAYRSVRANGSARPCSSASRSLKEMKWLDNGELMRDMPLMASPAETIMASASLIAVVVAAPARGFERRTGRKGCLYPRGVPQDVHDSWALDAEGPGAR